MSVNINGNYLVILGNGDPVRGIRNLESIANRLEEARHKHSVYAEGPYHALGVIGAEYRELEYAVVHESPERQIDESLNVIATAIRFVNREYE